MHGALAMPSRTIRVLAVRRQSLHPSVIAIRPKTGELVCHYQHTPNDAHDVDGIDEHALADITVDGRPRKVMIQANKNGFYVPDRTNCALDCRASLHHGQLGVEGGPHHRSAGAHRSLQTKPGGSADSSASVAPTRDADRAST